MKTTQKTTKTPSPRRQRNRDLMIQTILDTARAIMRQDGVAALSMQELARRLDIRAPSLYNYFPSKTAVYDALFRQGFTLYADHMQQAVAGAETWEDELQRTFEAYMGFALQNPELYQLCFERPVPGFVPSEASLQFSFGQLRAGYDRVRRWRNELQTDLAPERITDLVIAMMHGLTALHLSNEPDLPVGQGRFGTLIPAMLAILEKAWSKP